MHRFYSRIDYQTQFSSDKVRETEMGNFALRKKSSKAKPRWNRLTHRRAKKGVSNQSRRPAGPRF